MDGEDYYYADDGGFDDDDEDIGDDDEDEEVEGEAEGEEGEGEETGEFVDGQLQIITEEKADGFEDEELMNDELRDDDAGVYEEIVTEVKSFATGKNPYKTSRTITKYELPRVISTRAAQIQNGAPPLVKLVNLKTGKKLREPFEIAEEEFRQGKLPLMIRRPLPGKASHKYIYEMRPLNTLIANID